MRNINKRLMNALLAALLDSGRGRSSSSSRDIPTVLPADLQAADEEVRRSDRAWRQEGAICVSKAQVDQALQTSKGLQNEFNQAKARSRPSLRLIYLRLMRLFFLTGLPRYEKATVLVSPLTKPAMNSRNLLCW